jgi:rhodanese-related sulfurtransferase
MTRLPIRLLVAIMAAGLVAACGGGSEAESQQGIRLISPADGAALLDDAPDELVILDVRTLEEFEEGHIDGAEMLDFYREDFSAQLDLLDKDQPYFIYCRSGSRSGQTRAIMEDLGFTDVVDVDGGVLAWTDAGLALTG